MIPNTAFRPNIHDCAALRAFVEVAPLTVTVVWLLLIARNTDRKEFHVSALGRWRRGKGLPCSRSGIDYLVIKEMKKLAALLEFALGVVKRHAKPIIRARSDQIGHLYPSFPS